MALSKMSHRERLQRLMKMELRPEHVQNPDLLLEKGVSVMRDLVFQKDKADDDLVSLGDVRSAWIINESGYRHHPAFKRKKPPQFVQFPEELLGGSNSTKPKQKKKADKLWEEGKNLLFKHLTGDLVDTDALDEVECDCDGDCVIQQAKISTLECNPKFHEAGFMQQLPFVPCISDVTKNLPLYEPQTISFVSARF